VPHPLTNEKRKGEEVMIKSKSLSATAVVVFVFATAVINCALAGEKIETSAMSVRTRWHSIEVGDEGGHTIAVYENKQVYADEINGEKSTGINKGILDMNFKTGKGTIIGYTVRTFPNGDKMFSKYEGQPVGKGHSKGTYTITSGTGRLEGIKGSGTWESRSLAPGISHVDFKGERFVPTK
jgi:hypothetical protein